MKNTKNKKYILFTSTDFGGGVSRIIRLLSSNLNKESNIKIFSLNEKKNKYLEENYEKVLIKKFSSFHIARSYSVSWPLLSYLFKENPDIVHSHHYGYFPATAGFIMAKLKRKPFIISTYLHPPSKNLFFRSLFYLQYFTQGYFTIKFADVVVVSTQMEKDLIKKLFGKCKKIVVIPNPIDTNTFKKTKTKRTDNKKIVLYVGLLSWVKGADIFFDIAKRILKKRNDVKFVMIGKGELNNKFRIESKDFKENITILNEVTDKELLNWYSGADLFVSPTYYESFGMVIAEAMACETPIISTKVGAIPEVVPKGTGFLVDYGDLEKMENKIIYLLDRPGLMKTMGKNARKFIIKNFDLRIITSKFNNIYSSLLNK